MARYRQTCAHKARLQNAHHDLERQRQLSREWWRAAHSATSEALVIGERARLARAARQWDPEGYGVLSLGDITALERESAALHTEASEYAREAGIADGRAEDALGLVLELRNATSCHVCANTAIVTGNGSAAVGGCGSKHTPYRWA